MESKVTIKQYGSVSLIAPHGHVTELGIVQRFVKRVKREKGQEKGQGRILNLK